MTSTPRGVKYVWYAFHLVLQFHFSANKMKTKAKLEMQAIQTNYL